MSEHATATLRGLKLELLLSFTVVGVPIPQGSKSMMTGWDGNVHLVEGANLETMSKPANRLRDWRLELAYAGEQARLEAGLEVLNCALVLGVLFVMPRPIGHVTKGTRELCRDEQRLTSAAPPLPAVKPDLSKIVRALEDGLEGAVYSNDSRIVGYKEPLMIYDDERPPGADVEIWRVCG